jgi:hypothetical protein
MQAEKVEEPAMVEQVLSGLLIAGISGLAFIAYRHPAGYQKLFLFLHYGAMGIFILFFMWNMGVLYGEITLTKFIPVEKYAEAKKAAEAIKIPYSWLIIGYLGFALYNVLLRNIHNILSPNKR